VRHDCPGGRRAGKNARGRAPGGGSLIDETHTYTLDAIFAVTYVVGFFNKMGFEVVERGVLPLKAWKDCLRYPKLPECDKIVSYAFWGREIKQNIL
jgi:hypothetical protein